MQAGEATSWLDDLEFATGGFFEPAAAPALRRLFGQLSVLAVLPLVTPGRAEFVRLLRRRRPLTLRSASGAVRGLRSVSYGLALLYYGRIVRLSFCEWLDWASQANGFYQRDVWALASVARSAHEVTLEKIQRSLDTGAGFVLFLRDFNEEHLYDDNMMFFPMRTPLGRWRFMRAIALAAKEGQPVVTIGNPQIPDPTGYVDTGIHHLFVRDWQKAVSALIAHAAIIAVYEGKASHGLAFELAEILRLGKEDSTVLLTRSRSTTAKTPLVLELKQLEQRFQWLGTDRFFSMLGVDGATVATLAKVAYSEGPARPERATRNKLRRLTGSWIGR